MKRLQELSGGLSDDRSKRSDEEQARWLLVHMLEFHRREEKAPWWEYYRLRKLNDEELLEERKAISGLEFVKHLEGTGKLPIHRYRFPAQETEIRHGDKVETSNAKCGEVVGIDIAAGFMDIKKTGAMAEIHPTSVFSHTVVTAEALAESLFGWEPGSRTTLSRPGESTAPPGISCFGLREWIMFCPSRARRDRARPLPAPG